MKPLLALMFFITAANGGTWPDSMAVALKRGNNLEIHSRIQSRETSRPFESDFADAVVVLKVMSPGSNHLWLLKRNFEKPLANALGASSFENFVSLLKNPSIPDEAKELLLDAFLCKDRQVRSSWKVELGSFFGMLLASSSVSIPVKSVILRELGNVPSVKGDSAFLPYLNHSDPKIKTAAYLGLGHKIRSNRRTGSHEANRKIFDWLAQEGDVPGEFFKIRAMAQIGEDYGRNHLMPMCAGNAERIRTVLLHDPDLKHPGLIKEASEMLRQNGDPNLANAIRYGIKDPETRISQMLDGSAEDVESGLVLFRAYPEFVPSHASRIIALQNSGTPEIRAAAQALNLNLSNTAE